MKNIQLKLTPLATVELCFLVILIPITLIYFLNTLARRQLKLCMAEAVYAYEGEQPERTLTYLEIAATKGDPYYSSIHQLRGKIAADLKQNWGQATQDYQYLQGIYGSEALAYIGLGVVAINQSRDPQGTPSKKGISEFKQNLKQATSIESNYLDAEIYSAIADLADYLQLNEAEQASKADKVVKLLNKWEAEALKDIPKSVPSPDALVALYNGRGLAFDLIKDYKKATREFKKAWQYRKLWVVPYINYERALAKALTFGVMENPEERDRWLDEALNYLDYEKNQYYVTLNGHAASQAKLDMRLGTYALYLATMTSLNKRIHEYKEVKEIDLAKRDLDKISSLQSQFEKLYRQSNESAHRIAFITFTWTRYFLIVDENSRNRLRIRIDQDCQALSNRDIYKMSNQEYYKVLVNWGVVQGKQFGLARPDAEKHLQEATDLFPNEKIAYKNLELLYENEANRYWNSAHFDDYDKLIAKSQGYKNQGSSTEIVDLENKPENINTYRETKANYYKPAQEEFLKKVSK
jgi:hypothetical protein